jgi:hypothetical protein
MTGKPRRATAEDIDDIMNWWTCVQKIPTSTDVVGAPKDVHMVYLWLIIAHRSVPHKGSDKVLGLLVESKGPELYGPDQSNIHSSIVVPRRVNTWMKRRVGWKEKTSLPIVTYPLEGISFSSLSWKYSVLQSLIHL